MAWVLNAIDRSHLFGPPKYPRSAMLDDGMYSRNADPRQVLLDQTFGPRKQHKAILAVDIGRPVDTLINKPPTQPAQGTPAAATVPAVVSSALPSFHNPIPNTANAQQVALDSPAGRELIYGRAAVNTDSNETTVWYHLSHPDVMAQEVWKQIRGVGSQVGWTVDNVREQFHSWDGSVHGFLRNVQLVWNLLLLAVAAYIVKEMAPWLPGVMYEVLQQLAQWLMELFGWMGRGVQGVVDLMERMVEDTRYLIGI